MKKLYHMVGAVLAIGNLFAAPPVVKTVPWVATNPLIPHDTWDNKVITLKGAMVPSTANPHTYTWDFGDGSAVQTGNVSNNHVIEATHAYPQASIPVGSTIVAKLTVQDTVTGESATKNYYIFMQTKALPVETNVAIDEGLWYLHKTMRRYTDGGDGLDKGDWTSAGGFATTAYPSCSAVNVNAFEVNGHLETGSADNPYTETVQRGMRRLFEFLTSTAISTQAPNGNPDSNGNGIGIYVPDYSRPWYQGGMFMDAIIAAGTPAAIAPAGPANVKGRTYKDVIQDMVDGYAYGAYANLGGPYGVGWRYSFFDFPDNSACQWAAIGMIAAERQFGCTVPDWVKTGNLQWLNYSKGSGPYLGTFGYTGPNSFAWGTFAVTPSGLVQLAMDGVGRGNPLWDNAEGYLRDNFANTGGPTAAIKDHYYGLFSFTKSMLVHDSNGDKIPEPITLLRSQNPSVPPLDWYAAETSKGDPTDGVARTLIDEQNAAGYWYAHNYSSEQYPFETAQAIIMLNRTVFASGVPVAVPEANPNPGVIGGLVSFDGTKSFHQDPGRTIVLYEWDLDHNGTFEVTGPFASRTFPAIADYPVTLRVTDDASQPATAESTVVVRITNPPLAPTADAKGPYAFCPDIPKWFLDATKSVNPDQGQSEVGHPGDTIQKYEWDLDGDGQFDDAFGPQPEVKAFMQALGVGSHLVQLRVTDNTSASYPSAGSPDLSAVDSAVVVVKSAGECSCVDNLASAPKSGKVQLTWTDTGVDHYNIYRGSIQGGPYSLIGNTTSRYSVYIDSTVVDGSTYYYVTRGANALDQEACQSNEVTATPMARPIRSR